jgi:hypothetical protein
MREKYRLENLGIREGLILKLFSRKQSGKVWTGFNYLRIRSSGGLL